MILDYLSCKFTLTSSVHEHDLRGTDNKFSVQRPLYPNPLEEASRTEELFLGIAYLRKLLVPNYFLYLNH